MISISTPIFSAPNTSIKLSPTISLFHYQEFDAQNQLLNSELGALYGLTSTLAYQRNKLSLSGSASLLLGNVGYEGKTSKGEDGETDTSELILNISSSVSAELLQVQSYTFSTAAYFGYRYWKRNIHSTSQAAGPLEYYRWYYLGVGMSMQKNITNHSKLNSELILMFSPSSFGSEIEFNFSGYDSAIAKLGFTRGMKFNFDLLNSQTNFGLNFYYELWLIDRNDAVSLYKDGSKTNILLTEPKSITRTFGLGVSYQF